MKKILFVMQSLYNGGAEKSLVNLFNELPPNEYQVDLLLFKKEGMFLKQVPSWINILETPRDLRGLYSSVKDVNEQTMNKICGTLLARCVKKEGSERAAWRWEHFYAKRITTLGNEYDVAISYIAGEVLYYVVDKVRAKKKYVWIHNDYRTARHPKLFDTLYLKETDGIVSISERCVDILKEEFPELSGKMLCIENITSSTVTRNRAQEFFPEEYDSKTPVVLSIGRLMEQKGFDIAIDAARLLKQKGVPFQWYVIGDGELKERLTRLISEEDVGDCFKLIGTRENPYPYIANATVFAQTSRWEGKSVVLDEAKILGKPIVVTNYPTVRDQIEDGKEGIIVDMVSDSIAKGIETMIVDVTLREKISNYLQMHEYGNQSEVSKYLELINR